MGKSRRTTRKGTVAAQRRGGHAKRAVSNKVLAAIAGGVATVVFASAGAWLADRYFSDTPRRQIAVQSEVLGQRREEHRQELAEDARSRLNQALTILSSEDTTQFEILMFTAPEVREQQLLADRLYSKGRWKAAGAKYDMALARLKRACKGEIKSCFLLPGDRVD